MDVEGKRRSKKDARRELSKANFDDVFEVEKIVGVTKVDGKTLFRVRWLGYTAQCDTWEPYDNLLTCKDIVEEYMQREQRKKRKSQGNLHKVGPSTKRSLQGCGGVASTQDEEEKNPSKGIKGPPEVSPSGNDLVEGGAAADKCGPPIKMTKEGVQKRVAVPSECSGRARAAKGATSIIGGGGRRSGDGRHQVVQIDCGKSTPEPSYVKRESDADARIVSRETDGSDVDLIGEPRVARASCLRSSSSSVDAKRSLPEELQTVAAAVLGGVQSESQHFRPANLNVSSTSDSAYETGLSSDSSNDTGVANASGQLSSPETKELPSKENFRPAPRTSRPPPEKVGSVGVWPPKQYVCVDGVPVLDLGPPSTFQPKAEGHLAPERLSNEDLKHAVKKGDCATVELALRSHRQKELDLEQRNARGTTLLMMACMAGYDRVVELLIRHGADPNARHCNGCTPLMLACDRSCPPNSVQIVSVLLAAGAHVGLANETGETALFKACRKGNHKIVEMLLQKGANFAQVSSDKLYLSAEVEHCLSSHVAKVTAKFNAEVESTLGKTAKTVHALFPLNCLSLNEATNFDIEFVHLAVDRVAQSGVGTLLFIAHARLAADGVRCRLSGDCAVRSVTLNGIEQPPLTAANSKFIVSFQPVRDGRNVLNIQTDQLPHSELKLLVCAYEAQLLDPCEVY